MMVGLDALYPQYGFAVAQGLRHAAALRGARSPTARRRSIAAASSRCARSGLRRMTASRLIRLTARHVMLRPSAPAHRVFAGRQRRAHPERRRRRARADGRGRGARGMPAVALTDQSNLFAMVKFYRAAQSRGRQADHRRRPAACAKPASAPSPRAGAAVSERRRLSQSHAAGQPLVSGRPAASGVATIDRSWLDADNLAGLIALSGAREGDVGRALVQRPRRRGAQRAASAGSRCSAIATTSSCSAPAAKARSATCAARCDLAVRTRRAGRRDQRRALHSRARISSRTRRASAFTTARCSDDPKRRAATASSST